MVEEDIFALIIGGGPVGMYAALDLRWRGVPAILLNDKLETSTHPKCNFTSGRTLEYFRRLGVAQALRTLDTPGGRDYHYTTRFCGYELGRIPFASQARTVNPIGDKVATRPQTAELGRMIPQPVLEQGMRAQLDRSMGRNLRFGWKAVLIEERADEVVVTAKHVESNEERLIRAQYVVGCDGANSLVRRSIGASLEGEIRERQAGGFMSGSMLSYHVRSPNLAAKSGRPLATFTRMITQDFRASCFLQDHGTRWIFHFQVPPDADANDFDARSVVSTLIGDDEVEFEILSGGPWTGGLAIVATTYQSQRQFLCGDAAHLYTPMGGLGMNTGIEDAANISWKLAAVHAGWAGASLLSSFDIERRPIGERNARFGIEHTKVHAQWIVPDNLDEAGPEADAIRRVWGSKIIAEDAPQFNSMPVLLSERYETSPIVVSDGSSPPADDMRVYIPTDRAGARLPHYELSDGRALQDLLGSGYTLLVFSSVETRALEEAARLAGVPLIVVHLSPPPPESGIKRELILVRPDLFIAWSGAQLPSAPEYLINRVRGR